MQAVITEHYASSGCQIQPPHTLPPLLPPTHPPSICPFLYPSIVSEWIQGTKVCSICFNWKPISRGFMYINFTNLDSKWSVRILLLLCPFPDKTKKKKESQRVMKYSVSLVVEPHLKSPQIPRGRPLCGRDKNAEWRTEVGGGSRLGTSHARVCEQRGLQ